MTRSQGWVVTALLLVLCSRQTSWFVEGLYLVLAVICVAFALLNTEKKVK